MQRTKLNCNNFSGINRNNSVFSSSLITASDMQNVELFSTGINSGVGIRTVKGNVAVCDLIPEGEKVINIFQSVQNGYTHIFVHTESAEEGKLYLFQKESGLLVQKVDDLTLTGNSCGCDVSQGWADLFVFSNGEELLSVELGHYNQQAELDEVTMMNLTDGEGRTVKGLGIVVYAGRLWIFDKNILRYSVQENIYDFSTSSAGVATSAGYIEFVKNITAICPYLGTLAVFHSDSSCLVSSDDSGNFAKTMEFPGGAASYDAIVFHGTELYFYDHQKKGIFSFMQVINGDKTLGENIATNIREEIFSIPFGKLNEIRMVSVVLAEKNEIWFLVPSNDENNSLIMIYDYVRRTWVKRKSQKISCFAQIDGVLYSAGEKIYEEYSSNSFDGEFIDSYYKCAPLNFGSDNSLKAQVSSPKVALDMYYTNNFYVEYVCDYNSLTKITRQIKAQSLQNVLYFDIGNWDNSYFPVKDINTVKKLPVSFFKTLQITFLTKNSGDEFSIKDVEFEKIKIKTK